MASQKEIAEKLGISRSTVAAVLSGNGARYSQKTQDLVRQAAYNMGYQPDAAAQVIRKGVNDKTVAVICDPTDSVMQQVTLGVIQGLNQESYNALVFAGDDFEAIFRKIVSNRICGVVCTRKEESAQDSCAFYARKHQLRMILSMAEQRFEDFPVFSSNCKGNIKILFRYLYDLGHRNILFLHDGSIELTWPKLQWQSLREEWAANFLPENKLINMDFHDRENILPNLRKYKTTAILCTYPGIANWMEEFLLARGGRVPEDISIVSYGDNTQFLEFMPPVSITAVRENPAADQAKRIIDYLFHNDQSLPASAYTRFYEGELIVRNSSASLPMKSNKKI